MYSDVTPEPKKAKTSFKLSMTPFKKLAVPKRLAISAMAGIVLLIAGGAAFGLLHAKAKHVPPPTKSGVSASSASTTRLSAACSGVVRDIYRQTRDEDPSVTLAQVRSEVLSSGVSCAPVPAITAKLKDLSPGCRALVQYTFLRVRDGHPELEVNDIRKKVIQKSIACEHDRPPRIAAVAGHRTR